MSTEAEKASILNRMDMNGNFCGIVCVLERGREKEREKERAVERERERERERESERDRYKETERQRGARDTITEDIRRYKEK